MNIYIVFCKNKICGKFQSIHQKPKKTTILSKRLLIIPETTHLAGQSRPIELMDSRYNKRINGAK